MSEGIDVVTVQQCDDDPHSHMMTSKSDDERLCETKGTDEVTVRRSP